MSTTVTAALITSTTALAVAAISYLLAKQRERAAEWRKMKLDHYREFIVAMSGIIEGRSTPENQMRYSSAFNALMLVAPPTVFRPLQAFQAEITESNTNRSSQRYDILFSDLIRAIRRDVQPTLPNDKDFAFHFITVPHQGTPPEGPREAALGTSSPTVPHSN